MGDKPLASRAVIVTRSAGQAEGLVGPLEALGATVITMPVIAFVDPPDVAAAQRAAQRVAEYDWVVFGSTNAADRFVELAGTAAFADAKVAAVGSATAARLRELGVEVALVPLDFRAEGLVEAFGGIGAAGWRILVPRALEGRNVLSDGLKALGAQVDVVAVYRTVPAEPDAATVELLRAGAVDAVTFTSPSTAHNFVAVLREAGIDADDVMRSVVKAAIGPVTAKALEVLGHGADVVAEPSTSEGLADALGRRFGGAE